MLLVVVATLASPVAGQTDLEALYSLTLDVTNKVHPAVLMVYNGPSSGIDIRWITMSPAVRAA